jgi:hypothetical protein
MGAHARTRYRNLNEPVVGKYKLSFSDEKFTRTYVARNTAVCSDVVGNYPNPNGFMLDRYTTTVSTMSGEEWILVGGVRQLKNAAYACPLANQPGVLPLHASQVLPNSNELNGAVIKGMAATNPSRPVMSVPTFIGELKDLPGLVRNWGLKLIAERKSRRLFKRPDIQKLLKTANPLGLMRGLAEGHLTWKWVIRPMISDLMKILDFQVAVEKRFNLLRGLRDEGSISGKASVSESTLTVNTTGAIETQIGLVIANKLTTYKTDVWSSVQWKTTSSGPNASNLPESDEELLELSHRLVRGITGWESLQTAWELLPWSWFTDWFASVGTSIAAGNNTVHATPGQFCVMCERSAKTSYNMVSKPSWLQVSLANHAENRSLKWRTPHILSSPVSYSFLPILDYRKWLILESLAALKTRQ